MPGLAALLHSQFPCSLEIHTPCTVYRLLSLFVFHFLFPKFSMLLAGLYELESPSNSIFSLFLFLTIAGLTEREISDFTRIRTNKHIVVIILCATVLLIKMYGALQDVHIRIYSENDYMFNTVSTVTSPTTVRAGGDSNKDHVGADAVCPSGHDREGCERCSILCMKVLM